MRALLILLTVLVMTMPVSGQEEAPPPEPVEDNAAVGKPPAEPAPSPMSPVSRPDNPGILHCDIQILALSGRAEKKTS